MSAWWDAVSGELTVLAERSQAWFHRLEERWARSRGRVGTTSEEEALAGLRADRASQRWTAAAGLGRNALGSQTAIDALAVALADPEPFVRWQAAEALGAQEAGAVFPVLRAHLTDPTPRVRAGAAAALGRMGSEGAAVELRKALQDTDPDVRGAIALALGNCGDPSAGTDLLPLLQDPEPEVVCAAAHALSHIGNPGMACALAYVLAQPGQPLLVRRALAAALARVPHPETQDTLLAALQDPDPQVRAYAAQALGHVGNEAAWQPLATAREDTSSLLNSTVGEEAARALALLERRGRRTPPPPLPCSGTSMGDAV